MVNNTNSSQLKMLFFPGFPDFFVCLGRRECNAETNPQTDPGGRKTPRNPPSCGWPNNRKGETASPWQPALGSVYREVAGRGRGACVVIPDAWIDCLPACWLWWLKKLSVHSVALRVFKKKEGSRCSDWGHCVAFGGKQHLTHYIWQVMSVNMAVRTRASSKQKLNDVALWY